MTKLADADGHPHGSTFPDHPLVGTEIPELMANLARRMAEVWLQALATPTTAPSTPAGADRDSDYTAKELGKELQMSESTIYKHWRGGAWPNAYMISRRKGLRIPRRDVESWKTSKMPAKPAWGSTSAKPNVRPIRKAF
jgi:predicted DNA-binding transcriptional regulator AlpA